MISPNTVHIVLHEHGDMKVMMWWMEAYMDGRIYTCTVPVT